MSTQALVNASAPDMASLSLIPWYIPYGTVAQYEYTNQHTIDEGGLHDDQTEASPWLQWDYDSYYRGITPSQLASASAPGQSYVTVQANFGATVGQYSLEADESYGRLLSSEYKFRLYPAAESCEIQWQEKFLPANPNLGANYYFQSAMVLPGALESGNYYVDRTQGYVPDFTTVSSLGQPPAAQPSAPNAPIPGQVVIAPQGVIEWRERAFAIHRGFDPPLHNDVQPATAGDMGRFRPDGCMSSTDASRLRARNDR